jgi:hypothetical protein
MHGSRYTHFFESSVASRVGFIINIIPEAPSIFIGHTLNLLIASTNSRGLFHFPPQNKNLLKLSNKFLMFFFLATFYLFPPLCSTSGSQVMSLIRTSAIMSHNASVDIAVDEAMAAKAQAQAAAHAAELAALAAAPKPGALEKEGMPERFVNAGSLGGNRLHLLN